MSLQTPHPYVLNHLKSGTVPQEIKSNLRESGWSEEAADHAIKVAQESLNPGLTPQPKKFSGLPGVQIKIPFVWLLLVQLALGFEWLVSGLNKLISPNYPIEFGKQIADLSSTSSFGTVTDTIKNAILPSYSLFAYLLMYGEILVALGLLVTALIAILKKGYEEEVRRIIIPTLIGGMLIAIFSLLVEGLPQPPPLAATTPDVFIILLQTILLIAYTYVYSE